MNDPDIAARYLFDARNSLAQLFVLLTEIADFLLVLSDGPLRGLVVGLSVALYICSCMPLSAR